MEDVFATDTNELCLPIFLFIFALCFPESREPCLTFAVKSLLTLFITIVVLLASVAMFIFAHNIITFSLVKGTVVILPCVPMSDCYSCWGHHQVWRLEYVTASNRSLSDVV